MTVGIFVSRCTVQHSYESSVSEVIKSVVRTHIIRKTSRRHSMAMLIVKVDNDLSPFSLQSISRCLARNPMPFLF